MTAPLRQNVRMLTRIALLLAMFALSPQPKAAETDVVINTAERHVLLQTQGIPGKVQISMGRLDVSRLPACTALEAFSPPGTRLSGKTHVGVRCLGPNIWSVLVPAQISITGNYITTTRPLLAGQPITAADIALATGDLSNLPTGVVADLQAAIGKTLRNSISAGQPLRSDQLLAPLVIRQGQTVRVISAGPGFAVSSEGKAMNNAAEGQLAQIRMNSGQTVSGIAKADGSVEISF